jgi:hypothetical protein
MQLKTISWNEILINSKYFQVYDATRLPPSCIQERWENVKIVEKSMIPKKETFSYSHDIWQWVEFKKKRHSKICRDKKILKKLLKRKIKLNF